MEIEAVDPFTLSSSSFFFLLLCIIFAQHRQSSSSSSSKNRRQKMKQNFNEQNVFYSLFSLFSLVCYFSLLSAFFLCLFCQSHLPASFDGQPTAAHSFLPAEMQRNVRVSETDRQTEQKFQLKSCSSNNCPQLNSVECWMKLKK